MLYLHLGGVDDCYHSLQRRATSFAAFLPSVGGVSSVNGSGAGPWSARNWDSAPRHLRCVTKVQVTSSEAEPRRRVQTETGSYKTGSFWAARCFSKEGTALQQGNSWSPIVDLSGWVVVNLGSRKERVGGLALPTSDGALDSIIHTAGSSLDCAWDPRFFLLLITLRAPATPPVAVAASHRGARSQCASDAKPSSGKA